MFANICGRFLGNYGWGGTVMGIIMLVIPVVLIVLLFRYLETNRNKLSSSGTALETLKDRYAKGEITKEEFDKIKNDLIKP